MRAAVSVASRAGRPRRRRSATASTTGAGRSAGRLPDASLLPMTTTDAVRAMLGARSVAVVGASARPGSFGERLVTEVLRSPSAPTVRLVNPRYDELSGQRCVASLDDVEGPVDVVLLGVGDAALDDQLARCAARGDRSAVVFGNAALAGQRDRLAAVARDAEMALCGGGCMGFVNVVGGLRAIGYLERDPLPAGPIALVTHSGSAFSALLRTRRALGYTLAVSSGQELVTTAGDYVDYALDIEETRVVALLLESPRATDRLAVALRRAAEADVPVVLLTVGGSPAGAEMVAAHSGAIAGADAGWEALSDATGALRVRDLDEMVNTLELLALGVRARSTGAGGGIATAHDSGAERPLTADLAHSLGVPFADISSPTTATLDALLDAGLVAGNPLDVWGTGAETHTRLAGCLRAMVSDPAVAVTALSVDLVEEYDGDTSYVDALLDVRTDTDAPLVALSHVSSAVDMDAARLLRSRGVPVLEGTASGLVALRNLLALRDRPPLSSRVAAVIEARRDWWLGRLAAGPLDTTERLGLGADYGNRAVATRCVASRDDAVAAAAELGYPVVLKTDEAAVAHKSDVDGVRLDLPDEVAVKASYDDLAGRLGERVAVRTMAPPGVELTVGMIRDPAFGPIVIVAAGGIFVELLDDRAVALPPVDDATARRMVERLRCRPMLAGARGRPRADLGSGGPAVVAVAQRAVGRAPAWAAVDLTRAAAGPDGVLAVDVLLVPT